MSRSSRLTPNPKLILTAGEPAGIGPDIICQSALLDWPFAWAVIADTHMLRERAEQCGYALEFKPYEQAQAHQPGTCYVYECSLPSACIPGEINPENSRVQCQALEHAIKLCQQDFDAMVTAPLHKAAINQSGIEFSGHTEYLQHACGAELTVMLFHSEHLKVALATTHIPLKEVASAINTNTLCRQINLIHQTNPKAQIKVCGLNPHAGEHGYLGNEEINIITPAIKQCKEQGIDVIGPLSADTIYNNLSNTDIVLAMYHDQALPVVKALSFGQAVNVTLGLPFIRTSVDHGTALELAGSGKANPQSLHKAMQLAVELS